MVDTRKSMQASGQARDAAGRFKDENESNLGELPVPDDAQREVDTAVNRVNRLVAEDPDTAEYEPWLTDRLSTLTAGASMSGEDDRDVRIIAANIQYDPDGPGGSRSDYLKSHVLQGFNGCNLEVPDREALVAETKANILSTALNPERAYESLGLEYSDEDRRQYAEQHETEQKDDRHWSEVAYRLSDKGRREAAGVKGAASAAANRETRQAAAIEKHVGPLDDRMQAIYRQNVDKGLQHGSPFEDKMAFADALHELQDDGWDPEAGKAYRSSKEFRKLEKQLLDGRKPTRRYRQLRDALCDNEQEYKRFMTENPDVFDPDEKIVKPFAGLGSTVGQQAMLRLAAKHRGVDGALRLARRDPDIDYVVGDNGSKTYRVEHHHPYTTYDDTTGVHTTHDSPISANGIKPASVMGWIHGERVDDPKNQRERVRFMEAFGGEWKPADV